MSLWLRRRATEALNTRLIHERLLRGARAALGYLRTRDQATHVVCQQLERAMTDSETAGRSDSDVQSPGSALQSRGFG